MKNETLFYREAVLYATQYNLPVFPSTQTKIPLIENWYHQASKDPGIIKAWWGRWPTANISMPTGSISGIIVLDVDVKNGQAGFDSLRELELKFGDLPPTPTSLTPSGGQHFFFRYEGPPIGRKIRFMPGLDLMAEASQVLLPPSIGSSGKRYTWEISGQIEEINFAVLPQWIIEITFKTTSIPNQRRYPSRSASFWQSLALQGAPEGERNQAVAQMAGHLLGQKVDPYLSLELIHL